MSVHDGLSVVTLIMCIVTLSMATAALMPQVKQALLILRDGVLWTLLISVIAGIAFVGWSRFTDRVGHRLRATSLTEHATTSERPETSPAADEGLFPNRSEEAR